MLIKFTFFSPLENFMRREWEFHEDKLVAKSKSLNLDYESEVRYEKIRAIQNRRLRHLNWLWVTFIVAGLVGIARLILPGLGISNDNSIVALTEKGALVLAYIAAIPAFQKFEWYSFLDANERYLATVIVDERNKESMLEAIDLVKKHTQVIRETYLADPLPAEPPRFQITELNVPDFCSESTVRFYEDRLIEVERSWAEEVVTIVKYDDLGERSKIAKIGNDKWDNVFTYWLILLTVSVVTAEVFFFRQICGNPMIGRLTLAAFLLLVPMFFLKYLKSEILVFPNKQDDTVFWTRISASNRDELKMAVAFIDGKKPPS